MIAQFEHAFSSAGQYVLEVKVTDVFPSGEYYDNPISVFKSWNVQVMPEGSDNIAPEVVNITQDKEIEHDGDPATTSTDVTLIVESLDVNGHDLTYQWYLDDSAISDVLDEDTFIYEVQDQGEYDLKKISEQVIKLADTFTYSHYIDRIQSEIINV